MKIADLELLRYVSQMAWDGVPSGTIVFFKNIYPDLTRAPMKSVDMARKAGFTPQGAVRHRRVLEKMRYLQRIGRDCWQLNSFCLRAPFDQMVV